MPTYLIQTTLKGEPIGVWNEQAQRSYMPGNARLENYALHMVTQRNLRKPWPVVIDELKTKTNHQYDWASTTNASSDLEKVLSDVRDDWVTSNAGSATDRLS